MRFLCGADALLPAVCLVLTGCINVVPMIHTGPREVTEAKALAKTLRRLAPEAKELVLKEHDVANAIKVTLDVTALADPVVFRSKLRLYRQNLIEIRSRRSQVREAIAREVWQSPLVFAVQQDALRTVDDALLRGETWIQSAQNLQLRADLGQRKSFPELLVLGKELDKFLSGVAEEPLVEQIRTLQDEYRFGEGE